MSELLAKVMLVPDRHRRGRDLSSIKGYIKAQDAVTEDIFNLIEEEHITHIISLGDAYDRGYSGIGEAYKDILDDVVLNEMVKGNYYTVIGNHTFLDRDSNPEFYLTQPNNLYEFNTLNGRKIRKNIIRVVPELVIGPVQISFYHYRKEEKDKVYTSPIINSNIRYHVGIYHDDVVVPQSVRVACGIKTHVSSDYINSIYENITQAFIGHIHTKIGLCKIPLKTGRHVEAYIPGALTMTSSKESEYHEYINLPILEIYSDKMLVTFRKLSTHTEHMVVYKEASKVTENSPETYVKTESKKQFKLDKETVIEAMSTCDSIEEYLAVADATGKQKLLYEHARKGEIDSISVAKIITNQINNDILEAGGVEDAE